MADKNVYLKDYLLNIYRKPDRVLYYVDTDIELIKSYIEGQIPKEFDPYIGAFGTYDFPGVHGIEVNGKKELVLGLEFRADDERVNYPENMKSCPLKDSMYYSIEITNDRELTESNIRQLVEDAKEFIISEDSTVEESHFGLEALFINNGKARIAIEYFGRRDNWLSPDDELAKIEKDDLFNLAFKETITKFYNWNYLVYFLADPGRAGISDYAFVHFDIKDYSSVNELYGHTVGNSLLEHIARVLETKDWIYKGARTHDDNFAMMIKDMPDEEIVKHLSDLFEELSVLEQDPNFKVYFRCGVVPMRNTMLNNSRVADGAKFAQSLGMSLNKTDINFYTDKMHDDLLWAKKIKAYLDTAISKDEFTIYLQPKYDINQENVEGAEALVRWNYRNERMLSPGEFLPFFERDGSIVKIDDLVLKKVCECILKWKKEGYNVLPISVNLSRKQMENPNLIDHLTKIVDAYGIEHELIDFELTESTTYDNQDYMLNVLGRLRDRGFKISMDDFGTGYSSLSLLASMPLDTLKIDKSFVDNICIDDTMSKTGAVLKCIVSMSKELEIHCLAEGAELEEQVRRLRELGCEAVQGYYYSKPIPIEEYEKLIK